MPSVEINGVPEHVHSVLQRRALDAGQSLQEYLLARLVEDASRPTLKEALRRADGGRAGGNAPLTDSVSAIREDRGDR